MSYTVITTERAAQEISDAAAWWAAEHSVAQAERWYSGIRNAIADLAVMPRARPFALEHALFGYELRELHFGLGTRATHRAIFTIVNETVVVLTVRHVARGPLGPEDL